MHDTLPAPAEAAEHETGSMLISPMLAPPLHTVGIVALLLAWALLSAPRGMNMANGPYAARYVPGILASWMLLASVVAGLYRRRDFFRATLALGKGGWVRDIARGVGFYIATAMVLGVVGAALRSATHGSTSSAVQAMVPRGPLEWVTWLGVCITAGFCEEHLFRGYLLPQGTAILRHVGTGRELATAASLLFSSALFGAMHMYQGWQSALVIGVLGALCAAVALLLGNLRALIVAHAVQDYVGIILLHFMHGHHAAR